MIKKNYSTETRVNWVSDSWTRVKNHCRTTVNKEFTGNKPSTEFKKKLLISEHSPIRLLEVDWTWKNIKYWTSGEWARHKFEKFITSQRDDRMKDTISRDDKPQSAPVTYDGFANAQNTIDSWRKRLCYQATPEARLLAESFKESLTAIEPEWGNVLVPNCIYRCGCPEFDMCEQKFFAHFLSRCKAHNVNIYNIQARYDEYNEMFYEKKLKESLEETQGKVEKSNNN